MKCPYCGAENDDDVKFCTQCGKDIEGEGVDEAVGDEEEIESTPDDVPEERGEEPETTEEVTPSEEEKTPEETTQPEEDPVKLDEVMPIEETEKVITTPSTGAPGKRSGLKVVMIIFAVLAVVAVISVVAIFYGPKIFKGDEFRDDFETLDSTVWNVWRKGENVLIRSQGGELVLRNATVGLGKDMGKDYLIECGINILSTSDKSGGAGISFRAEESGRYMVILYPDKNSIVLKKQSGDVLVQKELLVKKGKWYLLAISVDGNKYAVFFGKKHIMTGTDIGFIKGGIGLEAHQATALFDDFYVEKR